jgi:hypothetical protein
MAKLELMVLLPLFVGLIFLNLSLVKRKGRSPVKYALLSVIPFVGVYLVFNLVSLPDVALEETVEQILHKLDALNKTPN